MTKYLNKCLMLTLSLRAKHGSWDDLFPDRLTETSSRIFIPTWSWSHFSELTHNCCYWHYTEYNGETLTQGCTGLQYADGGDLVIAWHQASKERDKREVHLFFWSNTLVHRAVCLAATYSSVSRHTPLCPTGKTETRQEPAEAILRDRSTPICRCHKIQMERIITRVTKHIFIGAHV